MPNYDAVKIEIAVIPAMNAVRLVVYIPDQTEPAMNLTFPIEAAETAYQELGRAIRLLKKADENEPGSPS